MPPTFKIKPHMRPQYRVHGPGDFHESQLNGPPSQWGTGKGPQRGGFQQHQAHRENVKQLREEAKRVVEGGDKEGSPELVATAPAVAQTMALIRNQPFAEGVAPPMGWELVANESYQALLGAALSGDILSCICNLVGLTHFHTIARVCTAWHDAIRAKMREWGMLTYVRSIGKGHGRLSGQMDMPTWITLMPDGQLCVVDSCNYRLCILTPGGKVSRIIGRPGATLGQLSSPSSVAYSPLCGPRRVFATSNVGPSDRRVMAFDLKTWALMESTPEGSGKTELDAPEGMAVADGLIFVVDTANSRINAFDIETIERVATYPPAWWGTAGRNRQGKGWDQLDNPQDVAAHEGEIFVSDTHNDRIQVFSTQLQWIGVIGCHGTGAGEFVYPRGLTVARELLYVCEQERIQVLTLLGEPRVVLPVPGVPPTAFR